MNDLERITPSQIEVVDAGPMEVINRSEVQTQVETAKRWPRDVARAKREAVELATLDEETAEACIYSLPRGGKPIEGPSVRLAEIMASAWGNIIFASRIVSDDGKFITAQGVAWDTEKNVRGTAEVQRRVTDKNGRRYSDDMVGVTMNAAASIATRNALLKVIPRAYTDAVMRAARDVILGDLESLAQRRDKMVQWYGRLNVTPEQLCAAVEVEDIEDIDRIKLATLKTTATAIRQGDTTAEEAFPKISPIEGGKTKAPGSGSSAPPTKSRGGATVPKPEPEPAAEEQQEPGAGDGDVTQGGLFPNAK